MKLNSKIKTIDIVNSPVPLVVNLSGKFEISYANHFTEEQAVSYTHLTLPTT